MLPALSLSQLPNGLGLAGSVNTADFTTDEKLNGNTLGPGHWIQTVQELGDSWRWGGGWALMMVQQSGKLESKPFLQISSCLRQQLGDIWGAELVDSEVKSMRYTPKACSHPGLMSYQWLRRWSTAGHRVVFGNSPHYLLKLYWLQVCLSGSSDKCAVFWWSWIMMIELNKRRWTVCYLRNASTHPHNFFHCLQAFLISHHSLLSQLNLRSITE